MLLGFLVLELLPDGTNIDAALCCSRKDCPGSPRHRGVNHLAVQGPCTSAGCRRLLVANRDARRPFNFMLGR